MIISLVVYSLLREKSFMRLFSAILAVMFVATMPETPAGYPAKSVKEHTIIWRAANGDPVYEGRYRLTKVRGKHVLALVEAYRYGPFLYRCMAPERIDHGNGIYIRNYLPQPSICVVPEGYKVCLQPAFVKHAHIHVLPYLYVDALTKPCKTLVSNIDENVYYRPSPLIPINPLHR